MDIGHGLAHTLIGPRAFPDQRQAEVGLLHEIAARTHPTVLGNGGMYTFFQQEQQAFDHLRAHARIAQQKGDRTREHRRTHGHIGQGRAHPARVAAHQIVLELLTVRLPGM